MGNNNSHEITEARAQAARAEERANFLHRQFQEQQSIFEQQRKDIERFGALREEERTAREKQVKAEQRAAELENQKYEAEQHKEQALKDKAKIANQLKSEQKRRALEAKAARKQLEEERQAAEERVARELEQERARVHAEKIRQWQKLNRNYPVPEFLAPFINHVSADIAADSGQHRRVNIGILGNSGAGKSSLIKAILERFPCKAEAECTPCPIISFEGDGTRGPTPYKLELGDFNLHAEAHIWDLPGQGTALFPSKTYLCNMGLKYFDAVIVVTDGRWTENDGSLLQAIKFAGIWSVVVRTKVDQAVDDGENDHGLTAEESLDRVRQVLASQIQESDPDNLHLVTTRKKYWKQFGTLNALCQQVQEHIGTIAMTSGKGPEQSWLLVRSCDASDALGPEDSVSMVVPSMDGFDASSAH